MFPQNTKFLVVDDFATMRKVIKKVLREIGYTNVEDADDGKTALPLLQQAAQGPEPFQFVISDWNMPGMAGIDLLKHCKADPHLKHLPFLMVTAEADQKNVVEAVQAGVSDYVVKPFSSQVLKQKLFNVYQRSAKKAA